MKLPFIYRGHHEDVVAELRRQLAEKEAERKLYLDLLGQMGWGVKFFGENAQPATEEQTEETEQPRAAHSPDVPLSAMRPSAIMRQQSIRKAREYEDKLSMYRKAAVLDSVAAIINDKPAEA